MTTINVDFGRGGANVVPSGAQGTPTLAETLRDVADDVGALQVATITNDDATDLAEALLLVNEIKGALNDVAAVTIKTIKG